ncbi:MAG: glycoside hydrolase family 2 protein [Candidatus Didemnitutus sp.]|nr:glycoside hydrolase family 2 protein [Candidatus Didemnitutus sp.]
MHCIDLQRAPWKFRQTGGGSWLPAQVPGCVHRDLLRQGRILDPFWGRNELEVQWVGQSEWEYVTTFRAAEGIFAEEHLTLVAEGIDTVASVYLNDVLLGRTDNMFVRHVWDIRGALRRGVNRLRVVLHSAEEEIRRVRPTHRPVEFNDPVGRCTVLRKQQCQFGWDWGPRLVTAGIWRPIRVEAWSGARFDSLQVQQVHGPGEAVTLRLQPRLAGTTTRVRVRACLYFAGRLVAEGVAGPETVELALTVRRAQLWWPAGQGAQPLYGLVCEVVDMDSGTVLDRCERRVGLRTIELQREPDEWGESFRFAVNGRPIFIKGANWIPAHSFVAGLRREDYERDLRSAVEAHMNMVRVWGGGIYESEDFYDLCDELGLLVWQDFMFACTLYPHDEAFLASVRREAVQQVRRLQHRSCLALWCGNNELPQLNQQALRDPDQRAGYEALFHHLLPEVIAECDGVTPYWPSSEWRGAFDTTHAQGEKSGDTHFWDVWHLRAPVKEYERWKFRFCSEFGMQSYSSPVTQATFCPPDGGNIFGPVMECHQKNRAGNQIILDYISRRYRFPKDQAGLIYLSQINQAYCMQVAVEHFRRISPRCMGTLYWQLNDCWPVASWSSIEFTGVWKAAHYAARRFFAPALVSARLVQEAETTIGNYQKPAGGRVQLFTVYDAPAPVRGTLRWRLMSLAGRCLVQGTKSVRLRAGGGVLQKELDFEGALARFGAEHVYLRYGLEIAGEVVSEDTLFFVAPRLVELPRGRLRLQAKQVARGVVEVRMSSRVYLHRLALELPEQAARWSDNYFDLHPGEERRVRLHLAAPLTPRQVLARLRHRSLVDSYL